MKIINKNGQLPSIVFLSLFIQTAITTSVLAEESKSNVPQWKQGGPLYSDISSHGRAQYYDDQIEDIKSRYIVDKEKSLFNLVTDKELIESIIRDSHYYTYEERHEGLSKPKARIVPDKNKWEYASSKLSNLATKGAAKGTKFSKAVYFLKKTMDSSLMKSNNPWLPKREVQRFLADFKRSLNNLRKFSKQSHQQYYCKSQLLEMDRKVHNLYTCEIPKGPLYEMKSKAGDVYIARLLHKIEDWRNGLYGVPKASQLEKAIRNCGETPIECKYDEDESKAESSSSSNNSTSRFKRVKPKEKIGIRSGFLK